jgi:hypothetical protein
MGTIWLETCAPGTILVQDEIQTTCCLVPGDAGNSKYIHIELLVSRASYLKLTVEGFLRSQAIQPGSTHTSGAPQGAMRSHGGGGIPGNPIHSSAHA